MNAVGVLVSLFFLFVAIVVFFTLVAWFRSRTDAKPDGLAHYMKLGQPRAWCGKKSADIDIAFDDWAKVTCPDCKAFGPAYLKETR